MACKRLKGMNYFDDRLDVPLLGRLKFGLEFWPIRRTYYNPRAYVYHANISDIKQQTVKY
jgi:hypothetical protein